MGSFKREKNIFINGRTFCLDKFLSSYIVVYMFVSLGTFLVIWTWKLVDQGFSSKFSLGFDALNTSFLFRLKILNSNNM